MATASEIADLITAGMRGPTGAEDLALHTGVVLAWDEVSGVNSVLVGNSQLDNLKTVQPGIGLQYAQGDVVMVVRKQTQYFVLGKISAPGGNNANQIKTAEISVQEATGSASYTDLATFGPQLTVNIGSSRRCLLMVGAGILCAGTNSVGQYIGGDATVNVAGASNIPIVGTVHGQWRSNATTSLGGYVSVFRPFVLTAANGLNPGPNTFTMQYRSVVTTPTCAFQERVITVIPF